MFEEEKSCLICGSPPQKEKHCVNTIQLGDAKYNLCTYCYAHLMLVLQGRAKASSKELYMLMLFGAIASDGDQAL